MADRNRLLELALKGLVAERAKLDEEIGQIKKQLGGGNVARSVGETGNGMAATPPRKRRRMSAAARKKISEAMKRSHAMRRAQAKK
jgi:hypothetical protein